MGDRVLPRTIARTLSEKELADLLAFLRSIDDDTPTTFSDTDGFLD
jgi:hypothetical protein